MNGQQPSEDTLLVTTATQTPCHRAQPSAQVCAVTMAPVSFKDRKLLFSTQEMNKQQAARNTSYGACIVSYRSSQLQAVNILRLPSHCTVQTLQGCIKLPLLPLCISPLD